MMPINGYGPSLVDQGIGPEDYEPPERCECGHKYSRHTAKGGCRTCSCNLDAQLGLNGQPLPTAEQLAEQDAWLQEHWSGPVMVACPRCGTEQEDFDGFGVLACEACKWCSHPSYDGDGNGNWTCGICLVVFDA